MKKIIFEHEGVEIELRRLSEMRYSIYIKDLILGIYLAKEVTPKGRLNQSQYERIVKEIIDFEYNESVKACTVGSPTFCNVTCMPDKKVFERGSSFVNFKPF